MLYLIVTVICAVLAVFGLYSLLLRVIFSDSKRTVMLFPEEGIEELELKLMSEGYAQNEILLLLPQNCPKEVEDAVKDRQILRIHYVLDTEYEDYLRLYGRHERNCKTERKR